MLKNLSFIVLLFCLSSCSQEEANRGKVYFYYDLKGFLKQEASRLNKDSNLINKQITKNDETEKRKVKITDWQKELDLFINSDINKPAWKDSYQVQKFPQKIVYVAKDEDLKTRRIEIKFVNNKVIQIIIDNLVDNYLYTSKEHLVYNSKTNYIIDKYQKVLLIGENNYQILGMFNQ